MRLDPALAKAYLAQAGQALLLLDNYDEAEFQEWRQLLDEMGFDDYISGNKAAKILVSSGDLVDEIMKILFGG